MTEGAVAIATIANGARAASVAASEPAPTKLASTIRLPQQERCREDERERERPSAQRPGDDIEGRRARH